VPLGDSRAAVLFGDRLRGHDFAARGGCATAPSAASASAAVPSGPRAGSFCSAVRRFKV
jgi:hypothetical protein